MKFSVKNAHGDVISGNVEVDDDRIRKADGDFSNLVGSSSGALFKLLKVWTNFDAHTPKQRAIISHCIGRKFLWEKGKSYVNGQGREPKIGKL